MEENTTESTERKQGDLNAFEEQGPGNQPCEPVLVEQSPWSPIHYVGLLHQLLDGGLSGLPATAQRVYLQLVRESIGRHRRTVRISHDSLRAATGLSRPAIQAALSRLSSPDVDLVNIVSPGRAKAAAIYEVRLYRYIKTPEKLRRKVRVRVSGSAGSMENILQTLSQADRERVWQAYQTLDPAIRSEYEEEIRATLQAYGWRPDRHVVLQSLLVMTIHRTQLIHEFAKRYPLLFPKRTRL